MPLKKGSSAEVVSENVREMMESGHPQKQAVAAALEQQRKSERKKPAAGKPKKSPARSDNKFGW